MPGSFGARIRQRREEQGIALCAIARQTKIKQSLLEALELDDVSQWPSGIYRRAFVRAVARAINLDPDVVVREFLETFPEPEVDVIAAMASALDRVPATGPTTAIRTVVGSAIGSLARLRRGLPVEDLAVANDAEEQVPIATEAAPPLTPGPVAIETAGEIEASSEVTSVCATAPPVFEPDLTAVARLCTDFGRLGDNTGLLPLLERTRRLLDAVGLIVWLWDSATAELEPALVYGYSERVVAHLPRVRRDADNLTAAAFRTAQTCGVGGSDRVNGALVVPLMTPSGCAGVLAIEFPCGREQTDSIRAVATILAAFVAQLVASTEPAQSARPLMEAIASTWS
jgi:transcriptional regulator with XRE-family HTH domain